jgi:hypothetical protein
MIKTEKIRTPEGNKIRMPPTNITSTSYASIPKLLSYIGELAGFILLSSQ